MFVIALLSLTLVALELAWTRIFSAEFFYTFAFLVLSLAVLGLGLGALAVHLVPALGRRRRVPLYLTLTALATLAGPPLVFRLGLDFTQLFHSWSMVGRFVVTLLCLNAAYCTGGMALATLFRHGHHRIDRLYMADLVGAGIGVVAVVVAMNAFGTPAATFYCALPVLVAALLEARGGWKLAPLVLAAGTVVLGIRGTPLLAPEREERAPVIHQHWDAAARIKVFDYGEYRGFNIDNAAHSPIYPFDGNWDRPDSLRFEFGIDVGYLLGRLLDESGSCTFLSLGAGGGTDILQALQAGVTEAHAVEVIPYINRMMRDGELAEYAGHIYSDPRVVVATEDARAYVRRHPGRFDFIYSLSSNTFAAVTSGAFAMAESYLFTTDAFADYWRALSDRGYMMMEHQFYAPRLVAEAVDALRAAGVDAVGDHLAVYDLPSMRRKMLLLSKRPLDDTVRTFAFGELTPEKEEHIRLLYPAPAGLDDDLVARIVTDGWRSVAATTPFDVSPCTDDRPYTAQLGLWKNFAFDRLERVSPLAEVRGFPLAKLLIVVILLVVGVLVVPLNLIPFAMRRDRLRPVPWLYFFVIGLAFMAVEVVLIQQFTLLVGPSVLSLATILVTLLVASGIGSRFARRVPDGVAFAAIVIWLVLDVVLFRAMAATLAPLPIAARMAATAVLVAPLGFFMGMPFPKAGLRVGEAIAWGFAVNGTASVLGSTAIVLVAFTHGYRVALLAGAALYVVAGVLLAARDAWRMPAAEVPPALSA